MSKKHTNTAARPEDVFSAGEKLFLVSDSTELPFDVRAEAADVPTLAEAFTRAAFGDPEDDEDCGRFSELVDRVNAGRAVAFNAAALELSRRAADLAENMLAEGAARVLMPLVQGRVFAVVRDGATGAELRRRPIADSAVSAALELSAYDWYLDPEPQPDAYHEEIVRMAGRYLEEGVWQIGSLREKRQLRPALFFAPLGTPHQRVFRPLSVCAKMSPTALGGFTEALRAGLPLRVAGLQDEPSLREAWERLAAACPLRRFDGIASRTERGRAVRAWLEAEPEGVCEFGRNVAADEAGPEGIKSDRAAFSD